MPNLYVIFVSKIIQIVKCVLNLQLKMSGVLFKHSVLLLFNRKAEALLMVPWWLEG